MLYAWIDENGILCTTYDIEYVPEEIKNKKTYVVFEHLNINDHDKLKVINGRIVLKDEAEILENKKQEKLQILQQYVYGLLSQTDWIIIKLMSLKEEGWSDAKIKTEKDKYEAILRKRKAIREWNWQIEKAIQNAKTIEELEMIKIEFEL